MKRLLLAATALALVLPGLADAQTQQVRINGRDPTGTERPVTVTADSRLRVDTGATSDANGLSTVTKGSSNLSTAQVSVSTTATLVAAARPGRVRVTVSVGAANSCAFGSTSAVTLTTGYLLQPVAGASRAWEYNGDLYAVCSAATTVSEDEIY